MQVVTSRYYSLVDQILLFVQTLPPEYLFWGGLICIYLFVLVLLGVLAKRIRLGARKVYQQFSYEVDQLLYEYAHGIVLNRGSIYAFEQALDVFFSWQKQLLAAPTQGVLAVSDAIEADARYLEQLVGGQVIPSERFEHLHTYRQFLQRAQRLFSFLRIIVAVLTLGVGVLFVRAFEVK